MQGIQTYAGHPTYGDVQTYRGHSCMPSYPMKWVLPLVILIIEVVMDIIWGVIKGMGDRVIITTEGETLEIKLMIEIGVGHIKDRIDRRNGRSVSNSRSRSGSRVTTNRDRIRCFECKDTNHFARDCPTTQANREAEQIQQMFNINDDQTILLAPLMDVDQDRQTISPVETRDNLNL